jgi:hypothetical protein
VMEIDVPGIVSHELANDCGRGARGSRGRAVDEAADTEQMGMN